ncbi:MAG: response regulator [Vicinamibacterales bacterium]
MKRPASVLIVDDEIIIARDLEARLRGMGYAVAGLAATGRDAIRLARARRPDLVLMDIVLKGEIDGIEAASQIRQASRVPVIYLTAYTDPKTLDRAKRTEPYGYIVKPFSERELQANIEMALYRHGVEERLRRVEHWLTSGSPAGEGVIAADRDGRITTFNEAAEAITAWPSGTAIGRSLSEVVRLVDRDTGEPIEATPVPDTGPVVCLASETALFDAQGALVPVEVSTSRTRDDEDQPTGSITLLRDPSGQRYGALAALTSDIALANAEGLTLDGMLEACARAVARHLRPAVVRIWTTTLTGELVLHGQAGERTPFDEAEARLRPGERLAGRIAESRLPYVTDALPSERDPELRAWAEHERIVAFAGYPLLVGERLVGVLGVYARQGLGPSALGALAAAARSLAVGVERKRLEEQLLQSQRMEAIGRIAGGVAHDFNNLLTIISGCSSLLLDHHALAHEPRRLVREVATAARHAGALTRRLLVFSRRRPLESQAVDLGDIVGDLERMLQRVIGEHIRLTLERQDGPLPVRADPGQIEQVLINLVVNARDAMPDGGVLTIRCSSGPLPPSVPGPGSEPREWARVAVADTGVGMTPAVAARIFEPFITTKDAGRGTGLGLATVLEVANQLGGHVGVVSEPGRGATFDLCLPLAETPEGPAATAAPAAGAAWPQGTETILLAEDEEVVRKLAMAVLERCGYRVIEAVSGEDVIAQARQHAGAIDLLLSDVVMPEGTGRVVADALRTARPGLRVLYMSGYTDEMLSAQGAYETGTWFLPKPFLPHQLAEAVRRALDA